jgi:hypothetical protein
MIFYQLKLQIPLQSLQTKTWIHCKQKWIIEIPQIYKHHKKYKIKQTWNERHGKHNWNKDRFMVYLGRHLKEVVISPNPHLNFFQIV